MYSIMKINSSVVSPHTLIVPHYEKLSNSLNWALKSSPEIDWILRGMGPNKSFRPSFLFSVSILPASLFSIR